MKAENQKITYAEAVKQLESVLEQIENPDLPLAEIEAEVKAAIELIKYCRSELKGYEEGLNKIIQ